MDKRILYAVLIVIVVIAAYAFYMHWRHPNGRAGFAMPPMTGSPQIRQAVFKVGGAMEVAVPDLRQAVNKCDSRAVSGLINRVTDNLGRAGQMLADADQRYLALTAADQQSGGRTPHKLSKSYGQAYQFLAALQPELDKLSGWIQSSSSTCTAMKTAGADVANVSAAITALSPFATRFAK